MMTFLALEILVIDRQRDLLRSGQSARLGARRLNTDRTPRVAAIGQLPIAAPAA